ncbi:LysR substrate-binding domain-containing protein [Serratia liquefaciens]|uniref:LysR substrate-binding domain-containing protein n=1 Tax=Serratia liquefaciens TaxID=614 RepID=UPI0022B99DA5|nr:LysR substrate-binding domain-containing protein [Serratia liquefaciens]
MFSERFPLHFLPTFVIAARLENLRATAQQVHLTHGAVSQQIQQLEQAMGCPLFERQGRGLRLNAAGRELLAVAEPTLEALQQGIGRVRRVAQSQILRFSVLPSFAHYWLMSRLSSFHSACADITLDIDASLAVQDLTRKGFDAAIRLGNGQWADMQALLIASGEVVPVATPALAQQWQAAFDGGTPGMPLLEHDVTPWHSWFLAHQQREYGRPLASFNDAGLLIRAAEQGFGIALVKKLLVSDALTDGRLVALAAARRLDPVDFYLVWPQSSGLMPAVEALLHWLQRQLA